MPENRPFPENTRAIAAGPGPSMADGPASAYIHVPFCVRKCAYCDFLSFADERSHACIEAYVDAVCREITLTPKWFPAEDPGRQADVEEPSRRAGEEGCAERTDVEKCGRRPLETVYFGGGTPSLLSPSQVGKILTALRDAFGIKDSCEITLEANPGTVNEEKLSAFREAGINRLSIGIQSLDDNVLKTLGRIHDSASAKKAILDAKNVGFRNISCDMMLGIPGQTMDSVKKTLEFFLEKEIPHISLYSLILEEGTPLYARLGGDIEKYVTQEQDREMYHYVTSRLAGNGYVHYEISNMARPGYESRHNSMYWRAEPYYAFGAGAHYYLGNERGRHAETLDEYIGALHEENAKKEDVLITEEILSPEDRMKEYMMLGFRTRTGVGEEAFRERFGMTVESAFGAEIEKEVKNRLVEYKDGTYRLTEKGVDLANQVFMDYV